MTSLKFRHFYILIPSTFCHCWKGRGIFVTSVVNDYQHLHLVLSNTCWVISFYISFQVDTWFSVDRFTGSKKGSLSFGGCFESGDDNTCPKADPSNFLIGRTEYNIMMYDSRAEGRKWNISFYDYSSNLGGIEVNPEYSKF